MSDPANVSDNNTEGPKFLERDFNQCFTQMGRYDSVIWEMCKFAFTAYTAVLGVAVGLYKFSVERQLDLTAASVAVLTVGLLVGLSMFYLIIRNRIYFVNVARYINEHRGFFLRDRPLGFSNDSGMYIDSAKPPFFSLMSSQIWVTHLIAVLNSLLLAVLVFILSDEVWRWPSTIAASVALLCAQVLLSVLYLCSREKKSAGEAVFGKS
jgi:hypothetical protein